MEAASKYCQISLYVVCFVLVVYNGQNVAGQMTTPRVTPAVTTSRVTPAVIQITTPRPFVCNMILITSRCTRTIVKPACNTVVPMIASCGVTIMTPGCTGNHVPQGTDVVVVLDRCNRTIPAPVCNGTMTVTPCPPPFVCNMMLSASQCRFIIPNPGCSAVRRVQNCGFTIVTPACTGQFVPAGTNIILVLTRCNVTLPAPACNGTLTVTECPPPYACNWHLQTKLCTKTIVAPRCATTVSMVNDCGFTMITPACAVTEYYVPNGVSLAARLDKCNVTLTAPSCNRTLAIKCFICNMTLVTPNCTLDIENPGCNNKIAFECGVTVETPRCPGKYVTPNYNITVDLGICNYSVPAPPCNGTAMVAPCPTPPPPFICNLTVWAPQHNFTIVMPMCNETVNMSKIYNVTIIAPQCYTEYVPTELNITVVSWSCNSSLHTPPCNGTVQVPECPPPIPVFYLAGRNKYSLVGDRISISCKWKHHTLFNHTWSEMITDRKKGTAVAVNMTTLDTASYSVFAEISQVEDVDYAYSETSTKITIVSYTLFIISATLAHGGRFQCANDPLKPTETGCIDIFITETTPDCKDNVTGLTVEHELMKVHCKMAYSGAYAPVMELFYKSGVTVVKITNSTVTGMSSYDAAVKVTRSMDGVVYSGKLYFEKMPDRSLRTQQNCDHRAPQSDLSFTFTPIVVHYGPIYLKWRPLKPTYEIGDTIILLSNSKPPSRFKWLNNKTGEIVSNSKSLTVSNEMVGERHYDIFAYNRVGRNNVLKELVRYIAVKVKPVYRGPNNPEIGNSKAKLYAAIISGIMVIILTTWVIVLLLMFDKEAVAHRIERMYDRHMEKLWQQEERRRLRLRELMRKKPKKKAAGGKLDLYSFFFGGGEETEEDTRSISSSSSSSLSSSSTSERAGKSAAAKKKKKPKSRKKKEGAFVNFFDDNATKKKNKLKN